MAFNSSEATKLRKAVQEYRLAAFSFLGVAHYNHNSIMRAVQHYNERILAKEEEIMAEVQEIIGKVEELANDSVGIANFAEQLVKTNPKLAESLEFILGVELQEKARREENAD